MKKLVIILALVVFVAFGALTIQNVIASATRVEMIKFDKDPKKASDKKAAESKDIKASEAVTNDTDAKETQSNCSDKSSSSGGCNEKESSGCCSSSPGKK